MMLLQHHYKYGCQDTACELNCDSKIKKDILDTIALFFVHI